MINQTPDQADKHGMFFCNRECEYFPCHDGVAEEEFTCLFCYCPLYVLGETCGGKFVLLENGVKDCSGCTFPHWRKNYHAVLERLPEVLELMKRE